MRKRKSTLKTINKFLAWLMLGVLLAGVFIGVCVNFM